MWGGGGGEEFESWLQGVLFTFYLFINVLMLVVYDVLVGSRGCYGDGGQRRGPSIKPPLTKPEVFATGSQTIPVASGRSALVICQPIRNSDGRHLENCI